MPERSDKQLMREKVKGIVKNAIAEEKAKKVKGNVEEFKDIEELSEQEIDQLYKNIEIHGDPFNGKELTRELLKEKGLLPKYRIETEKGNSMWFSSSGYNLRKGRIAIVAYVEKEGKLIARSYYRSNSQGLWRYLPSALVIDGKINWYSKGHSEESINLPAYIQKALAKITEEEKSILNIKNPELVFAGTARGFANSVVGGTYIREIESMPVSLGEFSITKDEKTPPEKIILKNDQMPDWNPSEVLYKWKQNSDIYGEIEMEAVPSMDRKLTYVFCKDKLNRVWIGSIENDSEIQSTGLRREWVQPGDLATPAFEYAEQAGAYGNLKVKSGQYVDMFEKYLSKIPIIRDYCGVRGIPLPEEKSKKRKTSPSSKEKIIVDQIDMGKIVDKKEAEEGIEEGNGDEIAKGLAKAVHVLPEEEKLSIQDYDILRNEFENAGLGREVDRIDFSTYPAYDLLKAKEILQKFAEDSPDIKEKKEFQIYLDRVNFFLEKKGIEEPTEDMPESAPDAAELMAKALDNINKISGQQKEKKKNRILQFIKKYTDRGISKEKQAQKEEAKERLRNIIEEIQYEKGNDEVLINSLEAELAQLQADTEALEKDQKENPFKYFIIENMHESSFRCIYNTYKDGVTFEQINHLNSNTSGESVQYHRWEYILPGRNDTVEFSSNGFTLQLQNKEEIKGDDGLDLFGPRAKYAVVNPKWQGIKENLSYEEGLNLLHEEAEKYQREMLSKFETQK